MMYLQNKAGLIEPESDLPYQLIKKDRIARENEMKLTSLEKEIAWIKENMQAIVGVRINAT